MVASGLKKKILIVTAQFNEMVTNSLRHGAEEVLREKGALESDFLSLSVPGAFELPLVAAKAARSGKWDAIICLGCVIRGETPHFDFVAGECARGLMSVQIETCVPVIFGVLTTENAEQALARAGLKGGNKGREAASVALEMCEKLKEV